MNTTELHTHSKRSYSTLAKRQTFVSIIKLLLIETQTHKKKRDRFTYGYAYTVLCVQERKKEHSLIIKSRKRFVYVRIDDCK